MRLNKVIWIYMFWGLLESDWLNSEILYFRMTLLTFVDETGVVDIKKFSKKMIISKHSEITLKMQKSVKS